MKTYSAKESEIKKDWILVDAENVVLGRLAVEVANRLRGKHKSTYTPHMDCGDNVIVINAGRVRLTGRKLQNKTYYWHTGYPGGIKSTNAEKILSGKTPENVVKKAVERMIPKGPLGRKQLANLRVYAGSGHPHDSQKPEILNMADRNPKNKRNSLRG